MVVPSVGSAGSESAVGDRSIRVFDPLDVALLNQVFESVPDGAASGIVLFELDDEVSDDVTPVLYHRVEDGVGFGRVARSRHARRSVGVHYIVVHVAKNDSSCSCGQELR